MGDKLTRARWTHVAIPVRDLERSIGFYATFTPLVVVQRNEDPSGRTAWLSNDHQVEDPFVLVLIESNAAADAGPGTFATLSPLAHLGIELPNREDVDAVAARAREIGALRWEPSDMPAHIGYICAVDDPDGNVVEFSHDQQVFAAVRTLWGSAAGSPAGPA